MTYDHNSERLSYSKLSMLADDPQMFHDIYVAKTKTYRPKKPQKLGSLAHAMLLEPNQLSGFVVMPSGMRRGTKSHDALMANHSGCIDVSEREWIEAQDSVQFMVRHPVAAKYFTGERKYENPVYGSLFGIDFQCKPDILHTGLGIVADIKTCSDLSDRGIYYSIKDYKYDLQVAIYLGLTGLSKWRWIFVKAGDTPRCRIVKPTTATIASGQAFAWRLVEEYKTRMKTGDWSSPWDREESEVEFVRGDEDETPVEVNIEVDLGDAEF